MPDKIVHKNNQGEVIGTSHATLSNTEVAGAAIGLGVAGWGALNRMTDNSHAAAYERYMEAHQFDKALSEAEQLIKRHNKDASGYMIRATTYMYMDRIADALKDLNRALALNEGKHSGWNDHWRITTLTLRAKCYEVQEQWAAALQDLSEALQYEQSDPTIWLQRGIVTLEIGDAKQALQDISKAVELNPGNAAAYYQRARVHQKMDNQGESLADINRAIRLDGSQAKYYELRIILHEATGNLEAAQSDLKQLSEVDKRAKANAKEEQATIARAKQTVIQHDVRSAANTMAGIGATALVGPILLAASGGFRGGEAVLYASFALLWALLGILGGHGTLSKINKDDLSVGRKRTVLGLIASYLAVALTALVMTVSL